MLRVPPSEVERMSALDVMRLARYADTRPCGPEHLDLLAALLASSTLRAAGARVTTRDCLPGWFAPPDDGSREIDDDAVRAQAEALANALKGMSSDA